MNYINSTTIAWLCPRKSWVFSKAFIGVLGASICGFAYSVGYMRIVEFLEVHLVPPFRSCRSNGEIPVGSGMILLFFYMGLVGIVYGASFAFLASLRFRNWMILFGFITFLALLPITSVLSQADPLEAAGAIQAALTNVLCVGLICTWTATIFAAWAISLVTSNGCERTSGEIAKTSLQRE